MHKTSVTAQIYATHANLAEPKRLTGYSNRRTYVQRYAPGWIR